MNDKSCAQCFGVERAENITDFLKLCEANYSTPEGERPVFCFVNDEVERITMSQFRRDIAVKAAACRAMQQTRVGIIAANSYDWVVMAFGLLLAGKKMIMFDVNLSDDDFLQLSTYTDAEAIITSDDLADQFDFLPKEVQCYSFSQMTAAGGEGEWLDESASSSFICFTSGTSKSSKGAVIRTTTLLGHNSLASGQLPGDAGERVYFPIPFHHIYAFACLFHIMRQGCCICIGSSARRIKSEMTAFDPQVAMLVSSMLRFILDREITTPSLRWVLTGGSPCPAEVSSRAVEKGYLYQNLYGLSETLGFICGSRQGEDAKLLKPIPGIRFFLNEEGELGMELPYHMDGYYKKPEDTERVLSGNVFWTGDSGVVDERGYARILGRLRDTIVLESGEKIHAEDKDNDLLKLPHVKDAAVFGGKDGLCAVIVPDDEANWEQVRRAVERYNRKNASFYRIAKYWKRMEDLPRTSTGKLRRFLLEKEYAE